MHNVLRRVFWVFLILTTFSFAAKVQYFIWEKGVSFEQYLQKHKISEDILKDLDRDDLKLMDEVGFNHRYFELIASNGVLLQTLLPIGDELQLHLFRTHTGYKVEIIPLSRRYTCNTFRG